MLCLQPLLMCKPSSPPPENALPAVAADVQATVANENAEAVVETAPLEAYETDEELFFESAGGCHYTDIDLHCRPRSLSAPALCVTAPVVLEEKEIAAVEQAANEEIAVAQSDTEL